MEQESPEEVPLGVEDDQDQDQGVVTMKKRKAKKKKKKRPTTPRATTTTIINTPSENDDGPAEEKERKKKKKKEHGGGKKKKKKTSKGEKVRSPRDPAVKKDEEEQEEEEEEEEKQEDKEAIQDVEESQEVKVMNVESEVNNKDSATRGRSGSISARAALMSQDDLSVLFSPRRQRRSESADTVMQRMSADEVDGRPLPTTTTTTTTTTKENGFKEDKVEGGSGGVRHALHHRHTTGHGMSRVKSTQLPDRRKAMLSSLSMMGTFSSNSGEDVSSGSGLSMSGGAMAQPKSPREEEQTEEEKEFAKTVLFKSGKDCLLVGVDGEEAFKVPTSYANMKQVLARGNVALNRRRRSGANSLNSEWDEVSPVLRMGYSEAVPRGGVGGTVARMPSHTVPHTRTRIKSLDERFVIQQHMQQQQQQQPPVPKNRPIKHWKVEDWGTESVDEQMLNRVILVQAIVRGFLARKFRRRLLVANEILLTEKKYVQTLRLVVDVFMKPLQPGDDHKEIIEPEVVEVIFSVIPQLLNTHHEFLKQLETRVNDLSAFNAQGLGDVFINQTDFSQLYPNYVNNFNKAMDLLERCKSESKPFCDFLERCERRPECEYQDLQSFLLTPIQRIPRYTMLLQDLLNKSRGLDCTRPYAKLKKATKKMKNTTVYINERKRDAENAAYVRELLNQLFTLPKENREEYLRALVECSKSRFIKEGKMIVKDKKAGSKDRYAFLFTDVLILTKQSERKEGPPHLALQNLRSGSFITRRQESMKYSYMVKTILRLGDIHMVSLTDSMDKECKTFHFHHGKIKFEFELPSPNESSQWVAVIQEALVNLSVYS